MIFFMRSLVIGMSFHIGSWGHQSEVCRCSGASTANAALGRENTHIPPTLASS